MSRKIRINLIVKVNIIETEKISKDLLCLFKILQEICSCYFEQRKIHKYVEWKNNKMRFDDIELDLELCIWKEIANKDLNKPDAIKTLEPDKECYICSGYEKQCRSYYHISNE